MNLVKQNHNKTLTSKNLKHFNLLSKSLILKHNLKLPFVLFFFYDFFDPYERIKLRQIINKYNLKSNIFSTKVIKLTLKSSKYKNLRNMLQGNIFSIYENDKNEISISTIKKLIKHEKLTLIFCIWNKKIYRHNQFQKLIETKIPTNIQLLQHLNTQRLKLRSLLFLFKTKKK